MSSLADLGALAPNTRTLEALAGSDILFSRLGGVSADAAALKLAELPPLDGLGLTDALHDTVAAAPVVVAGTLEGSTEGAAADGGVQAGEAGGAAAITTGAPLDLAGGVLPVPGLEALDLGNLTGALPTGALPDLADLGGLANGLPGGLLDGNVGSVLDGPLSGGALPVTDLAGAIPILGGVAGGSGGGLLDGLLDGHLADLPLGAIGAPIAGLVGELGTALDDLAAPSGMSVLQGVVAAPEALLSGYGLTGTVEGIVDNAGKELVIVGDTLGSTLADAGSVLNQPVADTANALIDDVHLGLELSSDIIGGGYTVHGVTALGSTIGLGDIGGENLLTDVAGLPAALSGGAPADAVGAIVSDVSDIVAAAHLPVTGLIRDLGDETHGIGVLGPDGALDGRNVDGLTTAATNVLSGGDPVGAIVGIATGVVGGLTAAAPIDLGDIGGTHGDPVGGLIGAVTGLAGGSGGAAAPLAEVAALPAALLGGDAIALPAPLGGGSDALVGHAVETVTAPVHDVVAATPVGGLLDLGHLPDLPLLGANSGHGAVEHHGLI